jgi:predicted HAD superfamily phosphohydrolase
MALDLKYWENSLNDIVSITDENLQRLSDERNRVLNYSQPTAAPAILSRPRAVSTTRANILQPSKSLQNSVNIPHDNVADTDRKLDLLFRKTKLLHEKLKKVEKESSEATAGLVESNKELNMLRESQKNDKKLILSLREHINAMKSKI